MKLSAPCHATDFIAEDINGERFQLSDYNGKPVILSFFRDAGCPFCNMRVFEFTQKHKEWSALGIEVIAIFSSPSEQIRKFVAKNPRPFTTIGDPNLGIYNQYGIEQSVKGLLKALLFKGPRIVMGFIKGAQADKNNPNGKIIPADFLIGPNGKVLDLWYGRNASDHMPMKRIERFVSRVRIARQKQAIKRAEELQKKASNVVAGSATTSAQVTPGDVAAA